VRATASYGSTGDCGNSGDLNPVAAGIAELREASDHTSVKERVDHVKSQGRTGDLKAASQGSIAGSNAVAGLEESHWLCPIEDRRRIDSAREGMLEGFSLGSYLTLLDYRRRLFREGKVAISPEITAIFERLGTSAETWQARLQKLSQGCLFGRFFAASRERLTVELKQLDLLFTLLLAEDQTHWGFFPWLHLVLLEPAQVQLHLPLVRRLERR
jgi:hypothetical protein